MEGSSCKERSFSVELRSKASLKNVTLDGEGREGALVEGTVGVFERAYFEDESVLEIVGSKGVLRIDVTEKEVTSHSVRNASERREA